METAKAPLRTPVLAIAYVPLRSQRNESVAVLFQTQSSGAQTILPHVQDTGHTGRGFLRKLRVSKKHKKTHWQYDTILKSDNRNLSEAKEQLVWGQCWQGIKEKRIL